MDWEDIIVGPATEPGNGARMILRFSGPGSHRVIQESLVCPPALPWSSRTKTVTLSLSAWSRTVEGELYCWPDARSYTGQESAEIHLPASAPLAAALLSQFTSDRARLARPGEFTLRAFLAGKLDLAQAEGVLGLIEAEDIHSLRHAIDQRAGGLSRPVATLRGQVLDLLADLEAGLDFVDEDISFVSKIDLLSRLQEIRAELVNISRSLQSRLIDETIPKIVLVGPSNAGKSSLFNAMVGNDAAIVSPIEGTTRDAVAARGVVGGLFVEWVDTAGWDTSSDPIMLQAGSQRTQLLVEAELILHCLPVIDFLPPPEGAIRENELKIRTKIDLDREFRDPRADAHVSLKDLDSLSGLTEMIGKRLLESRNKRSLQTTSQRCQTSLERSTASISQAIELCQQDAGQEYVAVTLREALADLGEIVGAVYTDDLLDRIFSRFCIGK